MRSWTRVDARRDATTIAKRVTTRVTKVTTGMCDASLRHTVLLFPASLVGISCVAAPIDLSSGAVGEASLKASLEPQVAAHEAAAAEAAAVASIEFQGR